MTDSVKKIKLHLLFVPRNVLPTCYTQATTNSFFENELSCFYFHLLYAFCFGEKKKKNKETPQRKYAREHFILLLLLLL